MICTSWWTCVSRIGVSKSLNSLTCPWISWAATRASVRVLRYTPLTCFFFPLWPVLLCPWLVNNLRKTGDKLWQIWWNLIKTQSNFSCACQIRLQVCLSLLADVLAAEGLWAEWLLTGTSHSDAGCACAWVHVVMCTHMHTHWMSEWAECSPQSCVLSTLCSFNHQINSNIDTFYFHCTNDQWGLEK
jgi:hypothetical protein